MGSYYGDYYSWPGHLIGGLVEVIIVIFLIGFIIRMFSGGRRGRGGPWMWHDRDHGHSAESLLKERFAKGEISKEEYEEKIKVLRQ